MKKSINKKLILKRTLQSLPIIMAAVAFVICVPSLLPCSTGRMERSVAVMEYASCYELDHDGKPTAWFTTLTDSLTPEGMTVITGRSTMNRAVITGCWINRYPAIASCRGMILTANPDPSAAARLKRANKNAASVIAKKISQLEAEIKQSEKKEHETDYYLKIHNVSDEGYNTMAAYATQLKTRKEDAERLLGVLKSIAGNGKISIRQIRRYTLLYNDEAGKAQRMECNVLTTDASLPLQMVQTRNKEMPANAHALYLQGWMTKVEKGKTIIAAAPFGTEQYATATSVPAVKTFAGSIADGNRRHDMPPLLCPDGAPLFSENGFFIGISLHGECVSPSAYGFGYKKLLQ